MSGVSPLSPKQVLQAVKALHAYIVKQSTEPKKGNGPQPLFEDEQHLLVGFTLCKIPDEISKLPLAIPLPHIVHPNAKICVFARTNGKKAKELLSRLGVQAKVIGVSKLEKKYSPYEMRRKLASSYDLFLCDETISKSLIPLLGKIFFQRRKIPVGFPMDEKAAESISKLVHSTLLFQSAGVCWTIKVGRTGQDAKELAENAVNAINYTVDRYILGAWDNIQTIHIKTDTSSALPVYARPPKPGLAIAGASVPVVPKKREELNAPKEDDEMAELKKLAEEAELDWISSDEGNDDDEDDDDDDDDDDNDNEEDGQGEGNGAVANDEEEEEDNDDDDDDEPPAPVNKTRSKRSAPEKNPTRALQPKSSVSPAQKLKAKLKKLKK